MKEASGGFVSVLYDDNNNLSPKVAARQSSVGLFAEASGADLKGEARSKTAGLFKGQMKTEMEVQIRNNAPFDSFFRVKSGTGRAHRTQCPRGGHARIL